VAPTPSAEPLDESSDDADGGESSTSHDDSWSDDVQRDGKPDKPGKGHGHGRG